MSAAKFGGRSGGEVKRKEVGVGGEVEEKGSGSRIYFPAKIYILSFLAGNFF